MLSGWEELTLSLSPVNQSDTNQSSESVCGRRRTALSPGRFMLKYETGLLSVSDEARASLRPLREMSDVPSSSAGWWVEDGQE